MNLLYHSYHLYYSDLVVLLPELSTASARFAQLVHLSFQKIEFFSLQSWFEEDFQCRRSLLDDILPDRPLNELPSGESANIGSNPSNSSNSEFLSLLMWSLLGQIPQLKQSILLRMK